MKLNPQNNVNVFKDLKLIDPILKNIETEGYLTPTPIQMQAIPKILARQDLLACAQTGTGKTAAFALPLLQILAEKNQKTNATFGREIKILVLTPTRELASQIGESFENYGSGLNIKNTVIFGGVKQRAQVNAIRSGVDIVVATPGRLLDLINQKLIQLKSLEVFVLDEADRMLDMGFIHDVKRIIQVIPKKRQTLFFSATMPPVIGNLAKHILHQPAHVQVTPPASTAEKISQEVYFVPKNKKITLLLKLLENPEIERALVFTRTKRDANRVSESLSKAKIQSTAIHGNKSQGARERALESIKTGDTRVLVATDIAARGIDVDGLTHVFNYDIPNSPESYVHRIGRTARAGKSGSAISLCSPEERSYLTGVEKTIRMRIPVQKTPEGLAQASSPSSPSHPQSRPHHRRDRNHKQKRPHRQNQEQDKRKNDGQKHEPTLERKKGQSWRPFQRPAQGLSGEKKEDHPSRRPQRRFKKKTRNRS